MGAYREKGVKQGGTAVPIQRKKTEKRANLGVGIFGLVLDTDIFANMGYLVGTFYTYLSSIYIYLHASKKHTFHILTFIKSEFIA